MPKLFDSYLVHTLRKDKLLLENSAIPIITVSASYKEDLKKAHGYPDDDTIEDIVFSRAHYSMALGVAVYAWMQNGSGQKKPDPKRAWIVDPTNYVSYKHWSSIILTEAVGKILARRPFMKKIKDVIDSFGRQKLPILKSITPPLLHLTENIHKPILSFHIAAGNILARQGKEIVQVITDPHVRGEYVENADNKKVTFCVFDEATKIDFLEKAALFGKKANPERVIVTGPPIDPRIIKARHKKLAWRNGRLNLCLTTGGLGTNKKELLKILDQLIGELHKPTCDFKLLIYAGTHHDIYTEVRKIAQQKSISVSDLGKIDAKLRIIYHPQIVNANEMLMVYGFPWAHGFITKPSGDMAYDAVASGSFLLTLSEWGEWEEKIREIFEQQEVSRVALTKNITAQLKVLTSAEGKSQSWVEKAMNNAHKIDPLFLNGAKNIVDIFGK
jgi:hypothetical protein